jgi:hypothetical protein
MRDYYINKLLKELFGRSRGDWSTEPVMASWTSNLTRLFALFPEILSSIGGAISCGKAFILF